MIERPIKVCVSGASGRSGSLVVQCIAEDPRFELCAALVSPTSPKLGAPVHPDNSSLLTFSSKLDSIKEVGLVIDFSTPQRSLEIVEWSAGHKIPTLIATTGHTEDQKKVIESHAAEMPLALVSNTSTAVLVLNELASLAQRLLGDEFDIEIVELHHRNKKDAPSGTALTLAQILTHQEDLTLSYRHEGRERLRGEKEVGVVNIRGGDAPGEHTVYFLGTGERIEITQRARDRKVFALGALRLGVKLVEKLPGLYTAKDLFLQ